jgi:hypothetical protein
MATKDGSTQSIMNSLSAYREFISSPAQLAACREATSIEQLLQQLKYLWRQEALTDDQLLGELSACNQQIHDVDIAALGGQWLPYRYQAKTRSIHWCLPQGHATEPFHDQYVERCRRLLLNQLITPGTSLKPLLEGRVIAEPLQPAGFIFHLSRCGSTLVSGCLAELDNTCVLSESPLLTEVMLDDSLSENEKQQLLPQLIHLQGNTLPDRHNIIIKWNAWDIFYWPLIRSLYPQVPVLFLVRDPVAILASHQRSAGRHMAGDKSLLVIESIRKAASAEGFFEFRDKVLLSLLGEIKKYSDYRGVLTTDYAHLTLDKVFDVAKHFNLCVDSEIQTNISARMNFHSKFPEQVFRSDDQDKQNFYRSHNFPPPNCELMLLYRSLSCFDPLILAEVN